MSDEIPSRRALRDTARPSSGDGLIGLIRRHSTAWLVSAIAVVFLGLGTGAVFTGMAVASTEAPPPAPLPAPGDSSNPRAVPDTVAPPKPLRTCSVSAIADDPRLETLYAAVRTTSDDPEVLWQMRGGEPQRVASVMKTFTAAAAIAALGPDFRITTSVVDGPVDGSIVLVGRGDATLSALPPGVESVYAGAPKLSALAAQVVGTYAGLHPGVPITQVVLDATYWSTADRWHESWPSDQRSRGYQSEVTALQVDGDRADPTKQTSERSTDPVGRAGEAFLQALRDADPTGDLIAEAASTTLGQAPGSASLLGEVQSQPVHVLVEQMLLPSDNTLAEMLARIVSKRSGLDGSAVSLDSAISSALQHFDIDTSGMSIVDGSGLSHLNAVSARDVAEFMALVQEGKNGLDIVRDALSVSGETGGLASRFSGDNAAAKGAVHAKTGWLSTAYSLAGYIDAEDGTRLTFSFSAVRDGIDEDARQALDTLATAVYRCGGNLASF